MSQLDQLISRIRTHKQQAAVDFIRTNPEVASIMSKLINPRDQHKHSYLHNRHLRENAVSQHSFQTTVQENVSNVQKIQNLIKLFPDMKLAAQILVSSILSPKDMFNDSYHLRVESDHLPSPLILKLNQLLEKELNNVYHHTEELTDILNQTLFEKGSYVKLILPENLLDAVISENVARESIASILHSNNKSKRLGILGDPNTQRKTHISQEHHSFQPRSTNHSPHPHIQLNNKTHYIESLEVTDNPNVFYLPELANYLRTTAIESVILNQSKTSLHQLYKNRMPNIQQLYELSESSAKRLSIGRAFVLSIPPESTIPVYIPGQPTQHVGYFIVLDEEGNPISASDDINSNDLSRNITRSYAGSTANDLSNTLVAKARSNLSSDSSRQVSSNDLIDLYASIVEQDLLNRLENGIYSRKFGLAKRDEVFRLMFSRSMANRMTRIVYVPAEFITYYAFDYHPNGIGKSLLDDLGVVLSIRAVLLFAKVMAQVKNSVAMTKVNMTLDPEDPDPQETIETAVNEIMRTRQQYFPLGLTSPTDLVDWIQRAGFMFSFEGHPGLPDTKFEFESVSANIHEPNSDLDEALRKQTYMAYGLSPEIVDNGYSPDFATSVIANNILFSKRILMLQNKLTQHMTDYVKKLIKHDMVISNKLLKAIETEMANVKSYLGANQKEEQTIDLDKLAPATLLAHYTECLKIELPKPDVKTLDNQKEAYANYKSALEEAIESWISQDIIPEGLAGDVSQNVDVIKNIVKAYFLRRWMSENNYLSELSDIVTTDENNAPMLDLYEINRTHLDAIVKSSIKFIESLMGSKQANDETMQNMDGYDADAVSSYSSSDNSSSSGGGDSGGDEFSMDMDISEEPTNEPTEPTEETPEEAPEEKAEPEVEEKPAEDQPPV